MALMGAVKKGGLLRGKAPQGQTSPLKPCVKGLRSDPEKKKVAMTLGIALFFPGMALGMALGMIWHAVGGRARALARRIFPGCVSCRGPWVSRRCARRPGIDLELYVLSTFGYNFFHSLEYLGHPRVTF